MSTTLSYGFIRPESGDRTQVWESALAGNVTQTNNHLHDGITSALIPSKNISTDTKSITSWTLVSTGVYRALVTCATGYTYDTSMLKFTLSATGEMFHPTVEKVSSTTFYVYTCDNATNVTVTFK